MDPRDEMFINRYRIDDNRFLEAIRPRHDMYTDIWLCDFKSNAKKFLISVNAKESGWMDKAMAAVGEA